jgi:hypothetical protein
MEYEGLESKMEWVTNHGKYSRFKLYPTKLIKEKMVTKMLGLGYDFNSKLQQTVANSRGGGGGFELNVAYAFDHWGLRKAGDRLANLAAVELMKQNLYLEGLDKEKAREVNDLKQSWKEPFILCKKIAAILDKYSSENGIMPPKPATLSAGFVP